LVDVGPGAHGPAMAMPSIVARDDAQAPWVVGRLELWGAALRLIQTRPLLGVGPDNFRHLYGAQLGLETWDERVQANNLYLELLVGVGVLGLAAFVWLIVEPLNIAARFTARSLAEVEESSHPGVKVTRTGAAQRRSASGAVRDPELVLVLGLSLAVGAFLLHALLDSFLAFTRSA